MDPFNLSESLGNVRYGRNINTNPLFHVLALEGSENACPNFGTILPEDEVESPPILDQGHEVMISPGSQLLTTPESAPKTCPECGTSAPANALPLEAEILINSLTSDDRLSLSNPRTNRLVDPISQFPLEIGSMIFELCISHPPRPFTTHAEWLPMGYSPLHLGTVCKAWRKVAWSTSRLWNFIPINLDCKVFSTEVRHKLPDGCEMTKDWLKRSGSALPLDIYVTKIGGTAADGCLEEPYCIRVINLINMYSSRWQHLDLTLPTYLLSRIKQGLRDSLSTPMLESLRVHATNDPSAGPAFYRVRMSDMAPKDVNMRGIPYESLNIMWTNLTYVIASELYTDEAVKMITNAPRLTFCALLEVRHCDDVHQLLPSTAEPHVHRLLSTLIYASKVMGPSELLNHITLPALDHFDLDLTVDTDSRFETRIMGFIHRSLPPITNLILCLPAVSVAPIIRTLLQLPSLTNLRLDRKFEPWLWTHFFRNIGHPWPRASGNLFLPKLQHLVFAYPQGHGPTLSGWDLILYILRVEVANPAANFWKVAHPPHSVSVWHYNDDKAEGEGDGPAPIRIHMAARHIIDLGNVVQAGIPFKIPLRHLSPKHLDLIGMRRTIDMTDPDRIYAIEWN